MSDPNEGFDPAGLRLTVIYDQLPLPADNGGKVDVWRRLSGLARLNVGVQLVCWQHGSVTTADKEALNAVTSDLLQLSPRSRMVSLGEMQYPPRVRRYLPVQGEYQSVRTRVEKFRPHALWLESWPAYLLARRLGTDLVVPLVYRSQNAEYDYWRGLSRAASGLRKLRLLMTASRIARLEREVRTGADVVLDISPDDAARCRELGWEGNSHYLPPTWLASSARPPEWEARDIDVLFVGNLWTPNNLQGLTWFIEKVVPLVRAWAPSARIMVAGSHPSPRFLDYCRRTGIVCLADPSDIAPLCVRARILINPQLSPGGLSMKMLDCLEFGSWIVSTPAGVQGLVEPRPSSILVRETEPEFADVIVSHLAGGPADPQEAIQYLVRHFGIERLEDALAHVAGSAGPSHPG